MFDPVRICEVLSSELVEYVESLRDEIERGS